MNNLKKSRFVSNREPKTSKPLNLTQKITAILGVPVLGTRAEAIASLGLTESLAFSEGFIEGDFQLKYAPGDIKALRDIRALLVDEYGGNRGALYALRRNGAIAKARYVRIERL